MIRKLSAALVLAVVISGTPASAGLGTTNIEGPDIPTVTAPVAVVTAFENERFFCTSADRVRTIQVPQGAWDRIILETIYKPDGDPWDRLYSVAINNVEVLRATTPRTTFTLRRDITEYATLLPSGGTADIHLSMGTYVGAVLGTVRVEFYANEPTAALARRPVSGALGVMRLVALNGPPYPVETLAAFPSVAPEGAVIELTLSNHGGEEGAFGPTRVFHVTVDGVEIATFRPNTYRYAFIGFGGPDPYKTCDGPQTTATGDTLHPLMWWTAQRAADAAGVYTGVGEIPSYRAEVEADHLSLLTGARTVKVRQELGGAVWITGLSVLFR